MGILNVTPDSFADPASRAGLRRCRRRGACGWKRDGADLIDIGGESTRPGAEPVVGRRRDWRACCRCSRALHGRLGVPISIDTYKAEVAAARLAAGAAIVNDVSGLRHDPALAACGRRRPAPPSILMHTRGPPATMYAEAVYDDLVPEVTQELRRADGVAHATPACQSERIIVDPGLGFAKQPAHSYGVLARLAGDCGGAGPSDAGRALAQVVPARRPPAAARGAERDWGTAAAVTAAVLAGAHIVRVHAVAEMVQVVRVAEEIRRQAQG